MQRGLLPEGQRLTSAELFVELEGEKKGFEELEDDEIVSLVKPQGISKSDLEGEAKDIHEACNSSALQVVFYADQFEKHALGNSEKSTVEQILTLADVRRGMQRKPLSGMRQKDMRGVVAPV
jgi:hypothetical protein